jgi:hypothetical protein
MRKIGLLAAVPLVAVSFALTVSLTPPNTSGDFLMLWTGSQLLGPDLYDWQKAAEIQRLTEERAEVFGFVRLPIMALALWPLAQLPIDAGFRIWQAVNLCALLAFVWLWSPQRRSLFVTALFPPLWWSLGQGQETCVLLLLVASGVLLLERNRPFAGGLLLALCSVKPHLFLLLPVVLIAQRRWRALIGMLTGGALVYALSAVIVGPDWPLRFLDSVSRNREEFRTLSPGLSLAFKYFSTPGWIMVATELAAAVATYFVVRGKPLRGSIVFAVTAGVLVAPWLGFWDLPLLLPLTLSMPVDIAVFCGVSLLTMATPLWPIVDAVLLALTWHAMPLRQYAYTRRRAGIIDPMAELIIFHGTAHDSTATAPRVKSTGNALTVASSEMKMSVGIGSSEIPQSHIPSGISMGNSLGSVRAGRTRN